MGGKNIATIFNNGNWVDDIFGFGKSSPAPQSALQNVSQYAQVMAQYQQAASVPPPACFPASHAFVERKIQLAIDALLRELPFRVVEHIIELRYLYDSNGFHLVFSGGHECFFPNADTFPTDSDIGRVCLEAP